MSDIKTKIRRTKFGLKRDFLRPENIVLGFAIFLCLFWTFRSIEAMTRNWELAERLTTDRKIIELLQVEVETAELENEYYRSEEYQELLARKQLDKKMPGENMVILPENSEAAKSKYTETPEEMTKKTYSNFEKWMMFLFPKY